MIRNKVKEKKKLPFLQRSLQCNQKGGMQIYTNLNNIFTK